MALRRYQRGRYYGPEAFKVIYEYLSTHQDGAVYDYCMVSYLLKNTVSENGTVSPRCLRGEPGRHPAQRDRAHRHRDL